MPANVGEMFYYGEIPWHRQGIRVEHPLTAEEAIRAGGLDWEVGTLDLQTVEDPASPVANRMAIVRLDRKPGEPGRVLGVAHRDFQPLQNRQGVLIFDAVFGRQKGVYHTGGYLKNGEVVWLLAKLPKEMEILAGDKASPYALFTNSYDGTIAIDFRLTTVRVVCQNTLALALKDSDKKTFFKYTHQGDYSSLQARAEGFFIDTMTALDNMERTFVSMAEFAFPKDRVKEFALLLFPEPRMPQGARRASLGYKAFLSLQKKMEQARQSVLYLSSHGKGTELKGIQGSLWGGLNVVQECIDHHYGYDHSTTTGLFGARAAMKRKTFDLAVKYLGELPRAA